MVRSKRSHDEYVHDNLMGVGGTVSILKDADNAVEGSTSAERQLNLNSVQGKPDGDEKDGEWQTVGPGNKRRKKNDYPEISHSAHARLQTFTKIGDLQNLVLYLLADGPAPQWCSVKNHQSVKQVVVLMVPGLDAGMFNGSIDLTHDEQNGERSSASLQDQPREASDNGVTSTTKQKRTISPDDYYPTKLVSDRLPQPLQPFGDMFQHVWPVQTPGDSRYARMHSPLASMLTTPIFKPKEDKYFKGPAPPHAGKEWQNNRTSITEFLASIAELLEEGYVLHPASFAGTSSADEEAARRITAKTAAVDGWVDTLNIPDLQSGDVPDPEIEKGSITAGRKVVAVDCEMCITSPAGQTPQVFSLTRISLINWDGEVILDELVKPPEPITDYLTPYSGITASMMENVTTTLPDIQQKLLSILTPRTILIGHSLSSDFNALKLTHPFIIDTTFLFPHPRGPPLKSSLKWLAQKYLSRAIQKGHGSTGHDSIEDARACLDLVKQKCEKGKAWGTAEASAESIFKRLARSNRPKRDKRNIMGDHEPRLGAVVDWGEPTRGYGGAAGVSIGCESDSDVVAGIKRALTGDEESQVVPRGGCDFVWGRFRELEAFRGWWDKSKLSDSEALRSSTATNVTELPLAQVVGQTGTHIKEVFDALAPCTAFIVYSGSGDPRKLRDMQAMKQTFKDEYKVKKWDELSIKWTDTEEQALREACEDARRGIGFLAVK